MLEQTITKTLNIGQSAPDFTLPTDAEGVVTLSNLKGKKVILYFYPKDDTPGCTLEAQNFNELLEEFTKLDTVVIGISKDNPKCHDKFKLKYGLDFILASDLTSEICTKYGVWSEKSTYGKTYMGIDRTTYLIDQKGVIAKVWNKVKVIGHASEVLEAVKNIF